MWNRYLFHGLSCYIINFEARRIQKYVIPTIEESQIQGKKIRWNQPNVVALGTLLWGIARQPVKVEGDSDVSLPRSVEVSGFVGRFMLTLPVAEIGFLQKKKLPPAPPKRTKIKRLSHWQSKVCVILLKENQGKNMFLLLVDGVHCYFSWIS